MRIRMEIGIRGKMGTGVGKDLGQQGRGVEMSSGVGNEDKGSPASAGNHIHATQTFPLLGIPCGASTQRDESAGLLWPWDTCGRMTLMP